VSVKLWVQAVSLFQLPLAGKCKWIFPISTFDHWFTAVSCQITMWLN